MSSATILAIETSTNLGSVALCVDSEISEHTFSEPHQQAKQLVPTIQQLLKSRHLSYNNLNKLVITSGPGSFTGLRIGLSVARMIHFANPKLECYSVTSLQCTAYGYEGSDGQIQVVLNAGKGEYYSQYFERQNDHWNATNDIELKKPDAINHAPQQPIIGHYDNGIEANPHARQLIQAIKDLNTPVASLKPYYFRPPDAKLPTKPYL